MRAWDVTGRGRSTTTSWAGGEGRSGAATILVYALLSLLSLGACSREPATDCAADSGPCTAVLAAEGLDVTLDITPKPVRAMKTLLFRLAVKSAAAPVTDAEVTVDLSMPGMTMPANRVTLVHRGGGNYEGQGVIVRCPSGRAVWRAEAQIRRPGGKGPQPQQARFIFGVK